MAGRLGAVFHIFCWFSAISEQFQNNFSAISEQFQGNIIDIIHYNSGSILEKFQSSFSGVSEQFQVNIRVISLILFTVIPDQF